MDSEVIYLFTRCRGKAIDGCKAEITKMNDIIVRRLSRIDNAEIACRGLENDLFSSVWLEQAGGIIQVYFNMSWLKN